jgi:acetyltransferase/esterase
MSEPEAKTLRVPGASIYYEVVGEGPVLLLIPGGSGDASPFQQLARALEERFTVVSYDRRGFSRSVLDAPPEDAKRLEVDSADAHRLIRHISDEPAFVLGSSSGAIVALDLLSRYPQPIRRLVAHEPPLVTLVPDAEEQLALLDDVYDTFRSSGAGAAMKKFTAAEGLESGPIPPPGAQLDPRTRKIMARMQNNLEFMFEHELRAYPRYVPDLGALSAVSDRLILAGGRDSRLNFPYRPNAVLAEALHSRLIDFPGGHVGYATHPTEFAKQLAEVLSAN